MLANITSSRMNAGGDIFIIIIMKKKNQPPHAGL